MADKKYQVFISSTYSDLKEERRKILDVLLMADCIPAGMEAFVASDVEQFEVIKKVIELCDYYVLIIGKRYGSINEQTGISYTEMEYDYAKSLDIPVLVFALDEGVEVADDKTEVDPHKIELLDKFRQKALTNRLASIWKTEGELLGAVAISIMKATKEIQRPGWQRATEYDEASLRREIMELQKERDKAKAELNTAKKEIISLTTINDVAYEGYMVTIKYKYHNSAAAPSYHETERSLPDLFEIIATRMMDVVVSEDTLSKTLIQYLFPQYSFNYSFTDTLLMKKILNQLKALGFVYSSWSDTGSKLYWGLTARGELERNKMILVRKPSSDS